MKTFLTVIIIGSLMYIVWKLPEEKKSGSCGCESKKDDAEHNDNIQKQRIRIVEQLPMEYENELPYTMPTTIFNSYNTQSINTANSNVPEASFAKERW